MLSYSPVHLVICDDCNYSCHAYRVSQTVSEQRPAGEACHLQHSGEVRVNTTHQGQCHLFLLQYYSMSLQYVIATGCVLLCRRGGDTSAIDLEQVDRQVGHLLYVCVCVLHLVAQDYIPQRLRVHRMHKYPGGCKLLIPQWY